MRDIDIKGHLAAVVNCSDDAILSMSLEGVILSWNRAAEALYGYTAADVVGRHISLLVPPDRLDELDENFRRVRAGQAVDHFDTLRVRKDGTAVPVSLTISPVFDDSGAVIAASTIARDNAERLKADELRFRLAAIVDSSDDAIISKSLDGVILSWNLAAEALYGYTAAEVVGRHISLLVPPDRPDEVDDILVRIRAGQAVDHFETLRMHKDGTAVPVSLTISPVLDDASVVIAASTIARDVTERHRLQQELETARDRALEVSRLKSDFLATMSHEIRTPMNGVIGMTGLLLDGELEPRQREYAETIRSSGEALLTIINDILDFSKIEAGRLDLESIHFDLRSVVEEVAGVLAEAAHGKGLELLTLVHPGVNTSVIGDPGRFRQILLNLVGNAIKFTAEGEVVIGAELAYETEEHAVVRMDVSDTGIGIAPAALASLFEPFSQADASTTRTHGGTGLGLAICRRLIDRMGGDIAVDSEEGRGTTFTFTVPLAKQPEGTPEREPVRRAELELFDAIATVMGGSRDSRAPLVTDHSLAATSGQPLPRLLVVDDNIVNQKVAAAMLNRLGYPSDVVNNGAEAVEATGRIRYGAVLMDCQMPTMDGYEATAEIRKRECGDDHVPIIAMTAGAMAGDRETCIAAGMDDYVPKPVKLEELDRALRRLVQDGERT